LRVDAPFGDDSRGAVRALAIVRYRAISSSVYAAIRAVLEAAGVGFTAEGGGRASAWLKRRRPDAGSRDIRRRRIAPSPFWIVRFATARR
jgi:hypothetical protein